MNLSNLPPDLLSDSSTETYAGFVTILGKPNVGKSTLLNTFLGVKVAPISPKPQTTRRGVRGIYTEDARQLIFVDTPGLHRPKDSLGNYMNREAKNALIDVDVVLWVVDLRGPPSKEDKDVARLISDIENDPPIYLIGNKLDAAKYPDEAIQLYQELLPKVEQVHCLSAIRNPKAVYTLRSQLLELLLPNPLFFPSDIRSDQSREDWASEIIRESCLVHLYQEIPYGAAVKVLEWRENKGDKPVYIQAEIWLERHSHRMIVLGKGGEMIREIGRSARKQLEIFLNEKVFLELEVVIKIDWRKDVNALKELGYE